MAIRRVLFCRCANSGIIDEKLKERAFAALRATDIEVVTVPDLCALAEERSPVLQQLDPAEEWGVVACYPRGVRSLLQWAGVKNVDKLHVVNLREEAMSQLSELLPKDALEAQSQADFPESEQQEGWPPWFPIIDFSRCVDCKQCQNFCLFGVYESDESGHVSVANPRNCKNHCPACARICPEAAIVFPKTKDFPINGAPIDDEESVRDQIQHNLDTMLGGDIYTALEERKQKRKRMLLQEEKALEEREKYGKDES
jgi:Pyruvate/2-oxoacid:ferredoxin oxidoreductase delta subunit